MGSTTSLERLSEFEIRIRSLNNVVDEGNRDMAYEAGAFWKEFNKENKVKLDLNPAPITQFLMTFIVRCLED